MRFAPSGQQEMRFGAVEDGDPDGLRGEHGNVDGQLDVALNDERIKPGFTHDIPQLRGRHGRQPCADLAGFIAIHENRIGAFEQVDIPHDLDPELLVDGPAQAEISQVNRHRLNVGRAVDQAQQGRGILDGVGVEKADARSATSKSMRHAAPKPRSRK